MSRGHQLFVATGRLGADPVTKAPQSGGVITEFRIACTEVWKGRDGTKHEHTEWIRAKLFGRAAEIAQQYLAKGSLVTIEGKVRTEKWQASDGSDRYSQWIYVDELHMHGGNPHEATKPEHQGRPKQADDTNAAPVDSQFNDDDIPF
jgi:single-strand DNA-binding protein